MPDPPFETVHEDDELLVINKPAGLVCHPTKGDSFSSLIGRVRLHLGAGAPAHLVHRLDRETSGLVLVAKNRQAARDLGFALQHRQAHKTYLGIVHGHPPPRHVVDAPTAKDLDSRVAIKDCVRPDGAKAKTLIRVLKQWRGGQKRFSLLELTPLTGRKHQLRIHLSHIGHPLVGDKLYGASELLYLDFVAGRLSHEQRLELMLEHHALHAWKFEVYWRGTAMTFQASPPPGFLDFCGETVQSLEWACAGAQVPEQEQVGNNCRRQLGEGGRTTLAS